MSTADSKDSAAPIILWATHVDAARPVRADDGRDSGSARNAIHPPKTFVCLASRRTITQNLLRSLPVKHRPQRIELPSGTTVVPWQWKAGFREGCRCADQRSISIVSPDFTHGDGVTGPSRQLLSLSARRQSHMPRFTASSPFQPITP